MSKWWKYFWVWQKKDFVELDEELDTSLQDDLESEKEIGQIALDILETEDEIIILAPIWWIDLEDIDLTFNQSILTIKWVRNKPEMFYDNVIVRNSECYWGKFVRNIILPENLDFDTIKASLENNLLVITILKLQFPSQHIKINKTES